MAIDDWQHYLDYTERIAPAGCSARSREVAEVSGLTIDKQPGG